MASLEAVSLGVAVEEFLGFDDVVIVPGMSPVEPQDVDIHSRVTRTLEVSIPVVSSPMDTVTEWRMAVLLARLGSVGVIHRNMSIEDQVDNVARVKSSTPSPWAEVLKAPWGSDLRGLEYKMEETGVWSAIVVGGRSVRGYYVSERADEPETWLSKARDLSRLLSIAKPVPTIDGEGRLAVGAAISPFDLKRALELERAGADFLVVDVAHAHNANVLRSLSRMVKSVSVDIVVGNLGTREGVLDVISRVEEVAGLRVGISSGSICTTGEVAGVAVPTLTAVINSRGALEELGLFGKIPIIADGGVRGPGDAAKAIIAGASTVMVGRLLAGTYEAPAPIVTVGGSRYKPYRGMASRGARQRAYSADRYSRPSKVIEEGVEGLVPYRGSAVGVLLELAGGLKASLGYSGSASIRDAWRARLARVMPSTRGEIRPHDIILE